MRLVTRGLTVLVVLLLSVVVVACGGGSSGGETTDGASTAAGGGAENEAGGAPEEAAPESLGKVSLGFQDRFSILPAFIAEKQGFFEANGITGFEEVAFTSLPAMLTAVSQGQITGAQSIPAALVAYNETASDPLRFFLPAENACITWFTRTDSDIPVATACEWKPTAEGFKEATIGIPAVGGLVDLETRFMAEEVGIDPSELTLTTAPTGPAGIAALKSGAIDIGTGDVFSATVLEAEGNGRTIISQAEGQGPRVVLNTLQSGIMAPESTLKKDPELYVAFQDAITEAREFMFDPANKAEVEAVIAEEVEVSTEAASALYKQIKATFDTQLDEATVNKTGVAMAKAGLTKGAPATYKDMVYPLPSS